MIVLQNCDENEIVVTNISLNKLNHAVFQLFLVEKAHYFTVSIHLLYISMYLYY